MEPIAEFLDRTEQSLMRATSDWDEEAKRECGRWFAEFRVKAIALDDAFDVVSAPLREKAEHDLGCRVELRMATLRLHGELLGEIEVFARRCRESLHKTFGIQRAGGTN